MSAPTVASPVVAAPSVSAPTASAPIVAAPVVSAPTTAGKWQHELFGGSDIATYFGALFCTPCLYSRAAQRLDLYPRNDPLLFHNCSVHGWAFYLSTCCCAWVPVGFKREELRDRFGIEGDLYRDFAAAACCMPYTLAQMNSELKDRAAKEQLTKAIGYQPQTQGMVYLPPNQQPQLQQQPAATAPAVTTLSKTS